MKKLHMLLSAGLLGLAISCQPEVAPEIHPSVIEIPVAVALEGLSALKPGTDAMDYVHMRGEDGTDVTGTDLITYTTEAQPGDVLVWTPTQSGVSITGMSYTTNHFIWIGVNRNMPSNPSSQRPRARSLDGYHC